MKKNKIIIAFAILTMALTILTGCATDPIDTDLTNYYENQIPALTELENSVMTAFNSVVEENFVDDQTLILKLKNDVIPNSNNLVEQSKAVTTETEELKAIHEKFTASLVTENSAFTTMLEGLENRDKDLVTKGNDLLTESHVQFQAFSTALDALAKEHGWVDK